MPWFIYNFPNDPSLPCSYTLVPGTLPCTGNTLCAIYATVQPGTIPAKPIITQELLEAIDKALQGEITQGKTKLRPNP